MIVPQNYQQKSSPTERTTLKEMEQVTRHWLVNDALPLWWRRGYDWESGMWQESLDMEGRPTPENRRARVQGRQTYVFSLAKKMNILGPWHIAVDAGFCGINKHFKNQNGLLRSTLNRDGVSVDRTNKLYDQTFVLLALSTARHSVENAYAMSEDLLEKIVLNYGNPEASGFVENCDRHPYQSNAHMHLFEAALSWIEACREDGVSSGHWKRLADQIADLAAEKFIDKDGGFLREFFNSRWEPKSGVDGTVVEPGHQFEWAWLFVRWANLSGKPKYIATAKRLFQAGINGINDSTGAAVNTLNDDLKPVTDEARLWPQTEWLKASLVLFEASTGLERRNYQRHIEQSYAVLLRFLETPKPGLWFDTLKGDNSFEYHLSPASSFYHIACAINQLRSTSESLSQPRTSWNKLAAVGGEVSRFAQSSVYAMVGHGELKPICSSFH